MALPAPPYKIYFWPAMRFSFEILVVPNMYDLAKRQLLTKLIKNEKNAASTSTGHHTKKIRYILSYFMVKKVEDGAMFIALKLGS